ncbi:MAG: Gfo/Idh/MocA family protein [Rhodothalassiaceae bacterium]
MSETAHKTEALAPRHVGLIALGSIGRRHLQNLSAAFPDCAITLVRRPDSAAPEQALPPEVRLLTDPAEAVSAGLDALFICSPAPQHLQAARLAVDHGVDLFIEKPIAASSERVAEMLAAADAAGVIVATGYVLRHYPVIARLRTHVLADRFQPIYSARFSVGQYLPTWRPGRHYPHTVSAQRALGGGALLELSHELDLANWLLGPFESVAGHVAKLSDLEIDVEDCVDAILVRPDGASVTVHLDFLQPVAQRQIEILGRGGKLTADLTKHHLLVQDRQGHTIEDSIFAAPERNDMYLAQQTAFFQCLRTRTQPVSNGWSALNTLYLAEAIARAAATGRQIRPDRTDR